MPNNACENNPANPDQCGTCGAQQTADLGSGYRPVCPGPAECQILTAQQAPIGVMNSYSQGVAAGRTARGPARHGARTAAGGCSSLPRGWRRRHPGQ